MKEEIVKGIEEMQKQLAGIKEVIKGSDITSIPEEDKERLRGIAEGLRHDCDKFSAEFEKESSAACEDIKKGVDEASVELEKAYHEIRGSLTELFEKHGSKDGDV